MSVIQYQNNVNKLDKEISDLEKKKAGVDSEVAKIDDSIAKNSKYILTHSSSSSASSKQRENERLMRNKVQKQKESADLMKKIADKRNKRNSEYIKLQKEQERESKKIEAENRRKFDNYQNQIKALNNQLNMPKVVFQNNISDLPDEDEYDVFISHAWEDKEDFVEEFVIELEKLGLKVWYDKAKMKLGDSMRQKIDSGLNKSKYGIVVLSPNYIAEGKYWSKTELDGLFQLESVNGKRIIPIWHNLQKKEVMAFSPTIAGKFAASTATQTPEEIAKQIKELFED